MSEKKSRSVLAERIKSERQKTGWSQAELAKILKLKSAGTVGNWESGTAIPDIEKLSLLADMFSVSIDYLVGRVNDDELASQDTENTNPDELAFVKMCRLCDELARDRIKSTIQYEYERCTKEPERPKYNRGSRGVQRLFLSEDIDDDYELMAKKAESLKKLKKATKVGYTDITKYLWHIGYGNEICLAFVHSIFGVGLTKKVPSQELYEDIEAFLKEDYFIIKNPKK